MTKEHINKLLDCLRKTENSSNVEIAYCSYDIDFTDLNDGEKMSLIILLYNMDDYGCKKKRIKEVFTEWSDNKIKNLAKEIKTNVVTLFDDEGHLAGKGYMFDCGLCKVFKREYDSRLNKNLI